MKRALGTAIGLAGLVVALGAQPGASGRLAFEPQWLSAVSAKEFWVGGSRAVLHTTDGGRHFTRLPAPPASAFVLFATSRDGFAFGWQTGLDATHDGGRTWHRVALRSVLAFATGGRTAYAVTGRCSRDESCRDFRLERSAVARDAWKSIAMPFARATPNFALAAHGDAVWLFGGVANAPPARRDVLARSTDQGRTFVTGPAPCYAELAAELKPVSSRVVWAFCPTGLEGIAWRSTNGGATFKPLGVPRCCSNGASLAPASAEVAVIAGNGAGIGLMRTTDGGARWRRATAPKNATYTLAFADSLVGLALVTWGQTTQLWKSTDAGATWHRVPIG